MSYLDLLPDDLMIGLLESRCDDIDKQITELEIYIEYCNDVNSDMDTFSDYYTADDDDELDDELLQQQHNDAVWLANINLNLPYF